MIGSRLGPYEITAKLGAGGMGEVWRASDPRLKRDVAIKVLPAAFGEDAERVARFEREAQVLAQLHHPHIASIFGFEESNGVLALVMELVEGPTLAERLERGTLPLEECLSIARQVAEALEAAHEKGIVHRDLKPQNIKLAAGGTVKVLDFGLAKAVDPAGSASSPSGSPAPMNSPTLTAAGGTALGIILGTAAYMAPEQAKGAAVDKRADIWAFGVVLYEMLGGGRLFDAPTVPETLAHVLMRTIDLDRLPPSTPAEVRKLLRRCLERDPKNRLRDIGDARIALAEAAAAPPASTVDGPPSIGKPRRAWTSALPWALAALALAVAGWVLFASPRASASRAGAAGPTHVELSLPDGVELVTRVPAGLAISPDGRSIAMIGFKEGQRRLYIRAFDRPDAIEIKGLSGVNAATFSPDGQSVALVPGSGRIVRVSLADQQSSVLASGADLRNSVCWGERDIYYLSAGEIWRVPLAGGPAARLTKLDPARREVLHTDPVELPGTGRLLFASLSSNVGQSRIESLSLRDGARSVVIENASTPRLSPTGRLLFERDGAVWAAAFDASTAAITGQAVAIAPAAQLAAPLYGTLAFQLSRSGTLVYMPREFDDKRLMSVGRDGGERAMDLPPGAYGMPRVSGDGKRLLLEGPQVLDALDFERGTRTRIASGTFGTSFAIWSADSRRIIYRPYTAPVWIAADGSGRSGSVPDTAINDYPASAGPDPGTILEGRIRPETAGDVLLVSIDGAFPPRDLLATPAYEGGAQLSPDGRFVVYQSNESGQPEIYVRRFPAMDRAWQVSEGGGAQTRWSRDGREIYYRGGGKMMAAAFDGRGSEPRLGRPVALFNDEYDFGPGISSPNYDLTLDGRFLMFRRTPTSGRLHVVFNWLPELERNFASGSGKPSS